jgi:hypothetical protein
VLQQQQEYCTLMYTKIQRITNKCVTLSRRKNIIMYPVAGRRFQVTCVVPCII